MNSGLRVCLCLCVQLQVYGNFLDAGLYIVSSVYGRGEVAGAGAGEGGSCTGQLPRPHHHSTAGSRGELGTAQGSRVCIAW